ncbi:MAG: polysaccharide biosynthesis protein [Candidatus Heimdallarchaeota archaeon]
MTTNPFEDKAILVTGAAGSIGRELVAQLLKFNPTVVRAFDVNETGLFYLDQMLNSNIVRTLVGDIRDSKRLDLALENIDIVFHAGALKHVPICEYNPFEAVKTNIVGTQNLIHAARVNNVKKFITISTDKAINPTNVMGATKLLAERLTIAANLFKGHKDISFSVVRFGNVLGSRGSVIPLLLQQIRKGEPVTVTDPEMTRYIMKIEDAVTLTLKTASLARGGEIFILKMPSVKLGDLVESLIEVAAPVFDRSPSEIKIKDIGKRIGEKGYEELLSDYETLSSFIFKTEDIFILIPKNPYYHPKLMQELLKYYEGISSQVKVENYKELFSSSKAPLLSKTQIKPLVQGVIGNFLNEQLGSE